MSQGDLTVAGVGRSGPPRNRGFETGRAKLLLSRYLGRTRLSRSFALPKHGFEK